MSQTPRELIVYGTYCGSCLYLMLLSLCGKILSSLRVRLSLFKGKENRAILDSLGLGIEGLSVLLLWSMWYL